MTFKRRKLATYVWDCSCERCGHAWKSVGTARPVRCAKCKKANWDRPARAYKRRPAPP